MKKDRNSFFNESSYMSTNIPNQNLGYPNQPFGTTAYANQGFYAGPLNNMPLNYNTNLNQMPTNNLPDYNDIESRLSKIERQLNRLDLRLNKLENNGFYSTDEIDNTTNVYMV